MNNLKYLLFNSLGITKKYKSYPNLPTPIIDNYGLLNNSFDKEKNQESGVRINGNYRGNQKNHPLIFLPLSNQNAKFLNLSSWKACTLWYLKILKPLFVKTLIFSQQTLFIISFFPLLIRTPISFISCPVE